MTLTYQAPETVAIGNTFPDTAFVLQNSWNLPELNLDTRLLEVSGDLQPLPEATTTSGTRFR